jgi:hypothetical protein
MSEHGIMALWAVIVVAIIGVCVWMGINASQSPLLICPPGYTLTVYDTYDGVRQWCIPAAKQ